MRRVLLPALRAASLALPLMACGEPLRLVLVEAGGSNALSQGGSDSGGAGGTLGGSLAEPAPPDPCAAEASAVPSWEAPTLYTASYVSATSPGHYIRPVESEGFIAAIDLTAVSEKEAATFEVIPGVWDCSCISLRAVNKLGELLRHAGSRIYVHPAIDDWLYLADATFCPEPGLADPEGLSFRSVNYPQRMIHLRNQNELWIDDIIDTPEFASESTFYRETALLER